MAESRAAENKKLKAFISYSRKDVLFAQRIVAALEARGLAPKIDTRDLPKLEDWRRELLGFIREADAVVFIVSPNSISSPVCAWEVEQVAALNKRLAPIVLEHVSDDRIPEAITKINYLFFDTINDFDARVDELAGALQTDLVWLKEHTRLGELGRRWDERHRPGGLTLRGQELSIAEQWIASRPRGAPEPTDLHKSFVAESRRAATRRLRLAVTGSLVIGALALGLATFAFTQRQLAEANRASAVKVLATSDFRQGTSLLDNDDTTSEAMALLSRSAREGHDKRALTRLWTLLQQRRFWFPAEAHGATTVASIREQPAVVPDAIKQKFKSVRIDGASREVQFISVSGDGKRVFTAIGDVTTDTEAQYRIWRSDGAPVTAWMKPAYNGDHYVYEVRGSLSFDGTLLALEVMGWRETAYLQIFDLRTNKQIGSDIGATGHLPNNQNVHFSRVQFVQEPARAGAAFGSLLLTLSEKGNAIILRVMPDGIETMATNEHQAPIVFAELDGAHEWLMSSSSDGTLHISRLTDDGGELIGNVLHLENTVTSANRVGNNGIAVSFGSGTPRFFLLSSAVKIPPAQGVLVSEQASGCKRWGDERDSAVYAMDAPADGKLRTSKGELNRLGSRQLAVVSQGVQVAASPTFSNEVILACLSQGGDSLAITTSDFVTEIWAIDFSRRLGLPITERRVFRAGDTPATTKRVFVPRDNKIALIESALWDPPNLEYQWYSLWDLETSLPLMDRTLFKNDSGDGEVERAAIDPMAQYIIFAGQSKEQKLVPLSSLHLAWPEAANNWIPDFVEAIGGVAINNEGVFEPVPERPRKVRQGFEKIVELVSRFNPDSKPVLQSDPTEINPGPIVTSSPRPTPQIVRTDPNPQPIDTSPPPVASYDPVGAVKAFYLALARADGDAAQLFVVPEKRGIGPFNRVNIKQFYSSLPKPMQIIGVELVSNDVVKVKYHFARPNGSQCSGNATVNTIFSAGRTLIQRISAAC
jgi:TIR domain